ncbi:pyridine nucleotide-disulfide oxidoreductase family protein [Mycobacterium xenopi 3993]|nr:pyridine nucleotide-disulfide oxidoreductase family protein [Mycobacterium xenopi 3993]
MATRIVILGGGPAGYEAALVAAARDAQVTVVDSDGIGGQRCWPTACHRRRSSPPPGCAPNCGAPTARLRHRHRRCQDLPARDPPAGQDVGRRAVRRHHPATAGHGGGGDRGPRRTGGRYSRPGASLHQGDCA